MTTVESRAWATKVHEAFRSEEDRAWTTHRVGQMTIADFYRLDLADIEEITPLARVRTRPHPGSELVGITAEGWLVRAEFEAQRWVTHVIGDKWAQYCALPYLRLVDDLTGFAFPDPRAERSCVCTPHRSARMTDTPPFDGSRALAQIFEEDEED